MSKSGKLHSGVQLFDLTTLKSLSTWGKGFPGIGRYLWGRFRRKWGSQRNALLGLLALSFFCISVAARIVAPSYGSTFPTFTVIGIVATFASLAAFAAFFQAIEFTAPEHQYAEALDEINKIIGNQKFYGISEVLQGGKFFEIIENMEVREGDKLKIYWSFLQHEEITDRFFDKVKEKNLTVEIMLFNPFSKALDQRTRELVKNLSGAATSNLKAKSLANIDFRNHFLSFVTDRSEAPSQTNEAAGAVVNARLGFTDAYFARPMIVVCKRKKESEPALAGTSANEKDAAQAADAQADMRAANEQAAGRQPDVKAPAPAVVKTQYEMGWRADSASMYEDIQVAMGYFLTNESSKYPFVVFRRINPRGSESEIARQSENICQDAIEFFNLRFEKAIDATDDSFLIHLEQTVKKFEDEFGR